MSRADDLINESGPINEKVDYTEKQLDKSLHDLMYKVFEVNGHMANLKHYYNDIGVKGKADAVKKIEEHLDAARKIEHGLKLDWY